MLPLLVAAAINFYSLDGVADLTPEQGVHNYRVTSGLISPEQLPLLIIIGTQDALWLHLHISRKLYGAESTEAIYSLTGLSSLIMGSYKEPRELIILYEEYKRPIQDGEYLRAKTVLALTIFEHYVTLPLHQYQGGTMSSIEQREFDQTRFYWMARSCLKDYGEHVSTRPELVLEYNALVERMTELTANL